MTFLGSILVSSRSGTHLLSGLWLGARSEGQGWFGCRVRMTGDVGEVA